MNQLIKWIKRWWKHTVSDNYVYVVIVIENEHHQNSICFYNIDDATDYAEAVERITDRTVYINYAELL